MVEQDGTTSPTQHAVLKIRSNGTVHDAKELNTLLQTSLKALFGSLERYGAALTVSTAPTDDPSADYIVKCSINDKEAVRTALTLVTPTAYLVDRIFCFDVVVVDGGD